jgi:hypothetical protein
MYWFCKLNYKGIVASGHIINAFWVTQDFHHVTNSSKLQSDSTSGLCDIEVIEYSITLTGPIKTFATSTKNVPVASSTSNYDCLRWLILVLGMLPPYYGTWGSVVVKALR